MEKVEHLSLFYADPTVDVEAQLANRLDPSMDKLRGTSDNPRRVTGIMAGYKTAGTGYLILRKNGNTMATFDIRTLAARTDLTPLDIELASGDELVVWAVDTEDTVADLAVVLRHEAR